MTAGLVFRSAVFILKKQIHQIINTCNKMIMPNKFLQHAGFLFAICTFYACSAKMNADLILYNAEIWTGDNNTIHQADAVAIKDGKILDIGLSGDIMSYKSDKTSVIDVQGNFMMPGFIEGHGHFSGLGYSILNLNFLESPSWEEIAEQTGKKAKSLQIGEWITGRGWHQEKWDSIPKQNVNGYPHHDLLSAQTKDNPVVLYHASGHSVFANSAAMKAAGVDDKMPDPQGGRIVRDNNGKAIGVFEERAMAIILEAYNTYLKGLSQEKLDKKWYAAIEKAEEICIKNGITSFQDAGSTFDEISKYQKLAENGMLDIRLWAMARHNSAELKEKVSQAKIINAGDGFFTCNAIKSEVDGALGAFGAWLLRPYDDKPGFIGQNTTDIYEVKKIADIAMQQNMQFCVHAIGDRANRVVLDIYEGVLAQDSVNKDRRWRIEHAQHLDTTDIPRFKMNNIIASMQGIHCTSDAPFVIKRLGNDRAKYGAYAWRSLLNYGVPIANGTDAPVEDVSAIKSFYASVTRKIPSTGETFFPEQKMTRQEALYSYTLGNAYAAFEEDFKGSITPGKAADIVILDKSLLRCSDEDILKTQVLYTIINGKIKYMKSI